MGSCFYSLTVAAMLKQIAATFGSVEPLEAPQGSLVQHLMHMCREMEKWPRTTQNAFKAGRWIGWMLHACEMLGLWNNEASRTFVRMDVSAKNDQPDRGSLWSKVHGIISASSLSGFAAEAADDMSYGAMIDSLASASVDAVIDS